MYNRKDKTVIVEMFLGMNENNEKIKRAWQTPIQGRKSKERQKEKRKKENK